MRVSTRHDDPGYLGGEVVCAAGVRVLLDGVEVPRCVTADEELGLVVTQVVDERGRVKLNAAQSDVLLETRRGVVRLVIARPDLLGMPASDRLNFPGIETPAPRP